MVILFYPLVMDETLLEKLPIESRIVLHEIYEYVATRVMPLKDEIDEEEKNETDEKPCCIIVHFPSGLGVYNYNPSLREKN